MDWERNFKKINKNQNKFPILQALFIQVLGRYGPIDLKSELKRIMLRAGLSEREYFDTYDTLKKMKVLKYNIGIPKGWYIVESAVKRVNKEYPDAIVLDHKSSPEIKEKKEKGTIDTYFENVSSLNINDEDPIDEYGFEDGSDYIDNITRKQFKKILEEWEEQSD
ncbi:MAG: hypothetical protein GF364_16095 [Candidatus Lokiarchaeota archaeon]|nr:hypothetical protein [Candidatus Lokiarchaeota archaeon]